MFNHALNLFGDNNQQPIIDHQQNNQPIDPLALQAMLNPPPQPQQLPLILNPRPHFGGRRSSRSK